MKQAHATTTADIDYRQGMHDVTEALANVRARGENVDAFAGKLLRATEGRELTPYQMGAKEALLRARRVH